MKALKIGIARISLLLAISVVPCIAFGSQQSVSEKNNQETTQEKNVEAVQQQNQGEEQQIQNQVTEQTEASQDNGSNDSGKNENGTGVKQNENKAGVEASMELATEEDNKNGSENGQKSQNQINQNQGSQDEQKGQGEQRRSRVANAVQEMLAVAERNHGIGQRVRTIAQNQNQEQEEMEGALQNANKRNGVVKFFIGPNYKELKKVENRLENHKNRLEELKGLRAQLENGADEEVLNQQIQVMEQIGAELENEVNEEKKGVSLFGWLFRWFSK